MSVSGEASRLAKLGRYELITQIGQGGMAEVQLALQRGPAGFEKLVVVKLVHKNLASQKAFVDMLLDEARVAALVKHPNVVDIYDLGQVEGRYFIAMEYLEGEPLLAVLRAGREGKRLDPLSTARLIADTAEGLDAAHELRSMGGDPIELVHHDVSLGNIVVLYNGQVKLVDFGVAKATQSAGPTTRVQGKFSYMAPEKLRGGAGDRRSDIWSLGVVLWEALTLRRLFKGAGDHETMRLVLETPIKAPSTVNGDVPKDFDAIVMRALDRDPAKRYPTAKAMAQDLEEVLRKQGYGGRNDQIAKYMQATFDSHIVARKKLLQEVSSKGRASADVLEAAFKHEGGTPNAVQSEFSLRISRTPASMAEGTPQSQSFARVPPVRPSPPALPAPFAPRLPAAAPAPSTKPAVPADNAAFDSDTVLDDRGSVLADVLEAEKQDAVPEHESYELSGTVDVPPRDLRKLYLMIGGAAAALVTIIVVSIVIATSGGSSAPATDPFASPTTANAAQAVDAAPEPVVVAADAAEPEIVIDPEPPKPDAGSGSAVKHNNTPRPPRPPTPPPTPPSTPKANPAELYRAGLQAFVSGDHRTALATFKRAQAANPGYAPTWRGLGMVYEKLGQKSSAKSSFQKYLQLAPNAPDAPMIKTRIDNL
ncbi:MAG TPA: tetratricopeptide repeat protein [Kofleriaceae bacterium]|nr:tetratricopeptide repeat protein [Kofleriaceae bacterium]